MLEGSVRTSGHVIRITAQLIRASDGTHLWSQTYDRQMSDIFKVQDEIAGTVVEALKATLTSGASDSAGRERNLEAYELLLKGNFFFARNIRAITTGRSRSTSSTGARSELRVGMGQARACLHLVRRQSEALHFGTGVQSSLCVAARTLDRSQSGRCTSLVRPDLSELSFGLDGSQA